MHFGFYSRSADFERASRRSAGAVLRLAIVCGSILCANTASADFRLCNNTSSRVGISIGYKDSGSWTTEGWWNLSPRSCETMVRGDLVARYYYVYAIDYDRGGEWSGHAYMCTRQKEFTIQGSENCLARGFDRTGFFEVDTGEQRTWTVQLTESANQPAQGKSAAPIPMLTIPPPGAAAPTAPPPSTVGPAKQ